MQTHDSYKSAEEMLLRQHWFSLDFNEAGRQKHWSVIDISEIRKILPEIFKGYALNVEGSWTGDLLIADTEDLQRCHHLKFT